jgi:hypothetical protein
MLPAEEGDDGVLPEHRGGGGKCGRVRVRVRGDGRSVGGGAQSILLLLL